MHFFSYLPYSQTTKPPIQLPRANNLGKLINPFKFKTEKCRKQNPSDPPVQVSARECWCWRQMILSTNYTAGQWRWMVIWQKHACSLGGPDRARTSCDPWTWVTYFPVYPTAHLLRAHSTWAHIHGQEGGGGRGAICGRALCELGAGEVICRTDARLVIISALGKQESCLHRDEISCFCTGAGSRNDCLFCLPNLIWLQNLETASSFSTLCTEARYTIITTTTIIIK